MEYQKNEKDSKHSYDPVSAVTKKGRIISLCSVILLIIITAIGINFLIPSKTINATSSVDLIPGEIIEQDTEISVNEESFLTDDETIADYSEFNKIEELEVTTHTMYLYPIYDDLTNDYAFIRTSIADTTRLLHQLRELYPNGTELTIFDSRSSEFTVTELKTIYNGKAVY